jgi:hypothetical protein
MFKVGNYCEAALWFAIGVAFLLVALRRRPLRATCLTAAAAFVAFGFSDVVEVHTGAWWRPWWLLAWKAACVGMFVWLLREYVRTRSAS